MPVCHGGAGSGIIGDPYIGATDCEVPAATNGTAFGASIVGNPLDGSSQPIVGLGKPYFRWYTVKGSDYILTPTHGLLDQLTYHYLDQCDVSGTGGSCNSTQDNAAQANAQTTVKIWTPSITTQLSASAIEKGQSVTDSATIALNPADPCRRGSAAR